MRHTSGPRRLVAFYSLVLVLSTRPPGTESSYSELDAEGRAKNVAELEIDGTVDSAIDKTQLGQDAAVQELALVQRQILNQTIADQAQLTADYAAAVKVQ